MRVSTEAVMIRTNHVGLSCCVKGKYVASLMLSEGNARGSGYAATVCCHFSKLLQISRRPDSPIR